ncbi:MAG: hypothetical protein HYZ91_02615 [Candidatus Omnitrophica bacterium]|nr:hypothetical protein [Candidatus Omnitrophota bacterium]
MGRQSRAPQRWELVAALFYRQFVLRSLGVLGFVVLVLGGLTRQYQVAVSGFVVGGWMVVNCAAIVWAGRRAVQPREGQRGRALIEFLAIVFGSLALGGWLIALFRRALLGVSVGLAVPIAMFFIQLRRLVVEMNAHAR